VARPRKPGVKGQCVDCPEGTKRMVRRPGPRCATHTRARKQALSSKAHAARIEVTYGITAEEYQELYEAQGGKCWICRRATGASRRLSVDHDHKTGKVRGLLCRTCNSHLGHLRDDPEAALRVVTYLLHPPADQVLTPRDWSRNLK
jgi:hypothetical protein